MSDRALKAAATGKALIFQGLPDRSAHLGGAPKPNSAGRVLQEEGAGQRHHLGIEHGGLLEGHIQALHSILGQLDLGHTPAAGSRHSVKHRTSSHGSRQHREQLITAQERRS